MRPGRQAVDTFAETTLVQQFQSVDNRQLRHRSLPSVYRESDAGLPAVEI